MDSLKSTKWIFCSQRCHRKQTWRMQRRKVIFQVWNEVHVWVCNIMSQYKDCITSETLHDITCKLGFSRRCKISDWNYISILIHFINTFCNFEHNAHGCSLFCITIYILEFILISSLIYLSCIYLLWCDHIPLASTYMLWKGKETVKSVQL